MNNKPRNPHAAAAPQLCCSTPLIQFQEWLSWAVAIGLYSLNSTKLKPSLQSLARTCHFYRLSAPFGVVSGRAPTQLFDTRVTQNKPNIWFFFFQQKEMGSFVYIISNTYISLIFVYISHIILAFDF